MNTETITPTATITLSYQYSKQRLVIDFGETGQTYEFHSKATEIKTQLQTMRRICARDYGFTFGKVKTVNDFCFEQGLNMCAKYEAEIEYL